MYRKTGDNAVDGNRRGLDVVGDVEEVIGQVCVVDCIDGGDGRQLAAACDVLLDETLPRLLANLETSIEPECQCNVTVRPMTTLDGHTHNQTSQ